MPINSIALIVNGRTVSVAIAPGMLGALDVALTSEDLALMETAVPRGPPRVSAMRLPRWRGSTASGRIAGTKGPHDSMA
jgi:hypothetical protein